MAKRANPYAEDYVTQSKVYMGMKQILNNNESKLNKIYEKTMELLFQGAKAKSNLQFPTKNTFDVAPAKDNKKQLCIGKDGTLLHTETAVVKADPSSQCGCRHAVECSCEYCEAALCSSCLHSCCKCLKVYCSRCMLVGCEEAEVCLSCYNS